MVQPARAGAHHRPFFYPSFERVIRALERYNASDDNGDASDGLDTESGAAEDALTPWRDPIAEALIARAAGDVEPPEEDDGEEDAPDGFDLLDLLDAMASHYGETIREMLQHWTWKLFCVRWVRLIEYMAHQRAEDAKRERDEAFKRLQAETQAAHNQRSTSSY